MTDIAIAILAGGQSRRMGRDKALLRLGDETLLSRTVGMAANVAGPKRVVVIGRERADGMPPDVTFLSDENPGDGPLAAIGVGLRWARQIGCDTLAVLACDLPLLTEDSIRWLIAMDFDAETIDGVAIVNSEGRVEPLFSVYSTRCEGAVAAQRQTSRRSPTALIEKGNFIRIDAPESVRTALVDVDTPEAWQAVVAEVSATD